MGKMKSVCSAVALMTLVLNVSAASAMGTKPDRTASYYINDLTKDGAAHDTTEAVVLPKKMLIGCAPSASVYGSQAKGFYLLDNGELYGFEGYPQIDNIDLYFQKKLKADSAAVKSVFDYAEKSGLVNMKFENYPAGADYCFVIYSNLEKNVQVSWAKDASLRDLNPPPADAVKIFDAVQNIAQNKAAGL